MSNLKIEKIEGLESKEEKKEKLVVGIDVAKDTLCFSVYNRLLLKPIYNMTAKSVFIGSYGFLSFSILIYLIYLTIVAYIWEYFNKKIDRF